MNREDGNDNREPTASVPDADVEMNQVVKRRDSTSSPGDAAAGGDGKESWSGTKKSRV